MIINGLSNFIIFRYRSVKWFYLVIYPFALLLLALILVLLQTDGVSTGLSSLYFLWLVYDLYFGYGLWKLNRS
jgi:tryptophan-rich sensory protein